MSLKPGRVNHISANDLPLTILGMKKIKYAFLARPSKAGNSALQLLESEDLIIKMKITT